MWDEIFQKVLALPPHVDVIVKKPCPPLPREVKRTLGEMKNQIADYEVVVGVKRIHITEFEDHYKVHWDHYSPLVNPIGHLRLDAPHWYNIFELAIDFLKRRLK